MAYAKRLSLALNADIDDAITKLAKLTGQPKTAVITELLNDSVPVLLQVIKAIEEAKQGQMEMAINTTAKFLTEATLQLNQTHMDLGEMKGRNGK